MAKSAGATRAGRAAVEVFADDRLLISGLRNAERRLKAFGASVTAIGRNLLALGAGLAAPLVASVAQFVKAGDQLDKLNQRTGISVETLSQLKFAAEQSGSGIEDLETAFARLARTLKTAVDTGGESAELFREIGIDAKRFAELSPEDQFFAIADGIASIEDPTRKAAVAQGLLGRSATKLLPLLNQGADGIAELADQADRLGVTVSGPAAKAAAALGDAFNVISSQIKSVAFEIGFSLADSLLNILSRISKLITNVIQWVRANRDLVKTAAIVAAGVIAAGAAFVVIGLAITVAGVAIGGFVSAASALAAIIAALFSPIALLGKALILLGSYFVTTTDVGASALEILKDAFRSLFEEVSEVVAGIRDALIAGDIVLAAKILWAGIRKVFLENSRDTINDFLDFTRQISLGFSDAFFGGARVAVEAFAQIRSAVVELRSFLAQTFFKAGNDFEQLSNLLVTETKKAANSIRGFFDSAFDAGAANAALELERVRKQQELLRERSGGLGLLQSDRDKALADIDKAEAQQKQALSSALEKTKATINGTIATAITATEQALASAQAELAELLDRARTARAEGGGAVDFARLRALLDKLRGLGDDDDDGTLGSGPMNRSLGTFNAAAIQSLQVGKPLEEIVRNTAEANRYLRRIESRGPDTFQ